MQVTGLEFHSQIFLPRGYRRLLAVHNGYLLFAADEGVELVRADGVSVAQTSAFTDVVGATLTDEQVLVATEGGTFAGNTALTGFEKTAPLKLDASELPRPGGVFNTTDSLWYFLSQPDVVTVFTPTFGEVPPMETPQPIHTTGIWSGWQRVAHSESLCQNGQRQYEERQDFTITTVGKFGGEPPPESPRYRKQVEEC